MKKVLVTGAAGSVGINVVKQLLNEKKYEITAVDLNNKKNIKRLKKYKRKINIVYGDINNNVLINALVKDHDVIIHLASIMPPFSELNKSISNEVEYNGTKNIIDAINKSNNNCHLLYASSTSIYNTNDISNADSKINTSLLDNYSYHKYKVENMIQDKLKHYTIYRISLILNNIRNESFLFNINKNSTIEVTTDVDVASCFVKSIKYLNKINKKIYNVGMGKDGIIKYNSLLHRILKYQGMSLRYSLSRIFLEKNYHSPVLSDSDKLDDLIKYRVDTLDKYYKRLKKSGNKTILRKAIVLPIIYFNKNRR